MKYNPDIHHRRSIRLKNYDYAQAGLYFITLCCQDRKHLFGKIKNGEMILNEVGEIVKEEWEKTREIRKNIALHEYIIMPNHFHAIIEILYSENKENKKLAEFKSPSQTIGAIIRGFKGATTKKIKILYFSDSGESKIDSEREGESKSSPDSTGELQFAPSAGRGELKISLEDKIWQRDYYEIIIRNQKAFFNISNYIKNNPKKWNQDNFHL